MGTVFLFGAGASYGSDMERTPPLGTRLFDELRGFCPDTWGTITGTLADRFRGDFEEAMKAVAPQRLAPLQRAMAAYFFEFRPLPTSLYLDLAQRIARDYRWSGAACTLNYERLLELSLLKAGVRPYVGRRAPGRGALELCLPHGCCHIFCEGAKGAAGAVSFNAFAVQTNGPVRVVPDPEEHRARIQQDAFPPVMSYFEPKKRTTAGHSFIEGQRARWRELALNATTLVIVGVRVRPHDDHIWTPVATSGARVVYCGGPSAAAEYSRWASRARVQRSDLVLEGYFRDQFATICAEAGL